MTVITTRLTVSPDGSVSLADAVPPDEYLAHVTVDKPVPEPRKWIPLPVLYIGPWPEGATFSREEIYGDDGR